MLLSAYTPAYLPWPGLFSRAAKSDVLVLLDNIEFSHGDITNRNRIKTANGVCWLTVPISGSKNQRIGDILVSGDGWRRRHEQTVAQAYSKAPFFQPFRPPESEKLAETAAETMVWLFKQLEIDVEVVWASSVEPKGKGSDLILGLCRHFGADEYLCGEMGRKYLDLDAFRGAKIKVSVEDYQPKPYPQLHGEFVPGLSTIDLVFNVGPAARDYL